MRCPRSFTTAAALLALSHFLFSGAALAGQCASAPTAIPAPSGLWDNLTPFPSDGSAIPEDRQADTIGGITNAAHPIWTDADYAAGFFVAGGVHGFDLFDVRTPAKKEAPVRIYGLDGYSWTSDYGPGSPNGIVDPRGTPKGFANLGDRRILKTRSWGRFGEFDRHGKGGAAKEFGSKIYFASIGTSRVGVTIWEFDPVAWAQNPGSPTNAGAAPRIIYAATGTDFEDAVFAIAKGPLGDTRLYLYAGSASNHLYTWDVSAAIASPCLGSTDVDLFDDDIRQAGSACNASIFRDAMSSAAGRLGSVDVQGTSSGALSVGNKVYSLANGADPALKGSVFSGTWPYPSAMWRTGSSIGMAVRGFISPATTLQIYDITNMINGSSSSAPLKYSKTFPAALDVERLVAGAAGGSSYLWLGQAIPCGGRANKETLWDVTNLNSVADITPDTVQGGVNYFTHYYPDNATGFDEVYPGGVAFTEDGYFLRSMNQLVDTHLLGNPSPTISVGGATVTFHGDPTVYTATANNCTPSSTWAWSTEEDTGSDVLIQELSSSAPCTSASCRITWVETDITNDVVHVSNGACALAEGTISVAISDPSPEILEVRMNGQLIAPQSTFNIPQCTEALFTTNTIGQAPLAFSWSITPASPSVQSFTATLGWSVGNASGLKALSLEASNNGGQDTDTFAANLQIVELTNLGFSGPLTVNQTGSSGSISVESNTVDASEWRWETSLNGGAFTVSADFGVGEQDQDFVLATGDWVIRVTARNCDGQQGEVSASTNTIEVTASPPVPELRATTNCTFISGQCVADTGLSIGFSAELTTGDVSGYRYDLTHTGATAATCSFSGAASPNATTTHAYSSPGTYHPCVEASGPGGVARTLGTTVNISTASPASISVACSPSSVMVNQTTTCTATPSGCAPGLISWNWTTSGGGAGNSRSIDLQWSTSGSKQVRATHTDCGTAQGIRNVTVTTGGGNGSVTAVASVSPSNPAVDETVTFDGTGSTGGAIGHSWLVRLNGNTVASYFGATATHVFSAPGTYTVELSVTDDLNCIPCFVTDTVTVVVTDEGGSGGLTADFTLTPKVPTQGENVVLSAVPSTGEIVEYLWTIDPPTGPNDEFTGQAVLYDFAQAGTYSVTLEVRDEADCDSIDCRDVLTKTVNVQAPTVLAAIINIIGDDPPIAGSFFTLDASASTGAPTSYEWEIDGQTIPGQNLTLKFDEVGEVLIKLTVSNGGGSDSATRVLQIVGDCDPDEDLLCLTGRRFKVEVTWTDFEDNTGVGSPFDDGTADSGLFWFFQADNAEMLVKIIDACGFNDRYWFSVAATTNVGYTVRVTDIVADEVFEVSNPLGNAAQAILDINAFATCDVGAGTQVPAVEAWYYPSDEDVQLLQQQAEERLRVEQQRLLDESFAWASETALRLARESARDDLVAASSGVGTCVTDNKTFCFFEGRFEATITYRDQTGAGGNGLKAAFETDTSGVFYFFDPNNWEALVKMVEGCAFNDHFWVFSAATTDQEFTLTLKDTVTGNEKIISNPLSTLAPSVTDIQAFPCQ